MGDSVAEMVEMAEDSVAEMGEDSVAEMAEDWNHDDVGQPVIKWGEKPREYRWSAIGEGAVSVPAAGNTWVAPHREDDPRESDRFRVIPLPAACTVHFH